MDNDLIERFLEWGKKKGWVIELAKSTMPIIMSIGGDYQYYAINIDSGEVVQGWEPEFEESFVVAGSFVEFIEKITTGEIILL